jgi:hypothetical protein
MIHVSLSPGAGTALFYIYGMCLKDLRNQVEDRCRTGCIVHSSCRLIVCCCVHDDPYCYCRCKYPYDYCYKFCCRY